MSLPDFPCAAALRETTRTIAPKLLMVDPEAAAWKPGSGKWSVKEIVGHLIDSAANNHQRFVRALWMDDLVFPGYDQEAWVELQRYQSASWVELVNLWRGYNLHLARVMEAIPQEVRMREHRRHNLDEIAWRPVPADAPATLDYFMRDYVDHLQHHLEQIRAALDDLES